ncbi:MAG: VWA domain-containing protein [Romboutsia sp.]|nr:VWA domain-containing protein [Romboutsia sp.]
MAGELILQTGFNKPYLLNDSNEKQIKACFSIKPSDEVRMELNNIDSNQGVDLCIVLDVSDSMSKYLDRTGIQPTGETGIDEYGKVVHYCTGGRSRLDVAVDSAIKIAQMVRPEDNISCIIYADNPSIIFKNYSGRDKDRIIEQLEDIPKKMIGNNTNISAAIREARGILVNNKDLRPKKILFLTDGVPTVDKPEDGIREGEYLAEYNISIECLGLDKDVDLLYLEQIAAPSNGSANFITQAHEVERLFIKIFEKTKSVIITDAKLKLTFSNAIRVTDHYRGTPENVYLGKVKLDKTRSFVINLGQIQKNQLYKYYFNATVPAQEGYAGPLRIAKAELEYKIPAISGNQPISVTQNVSLEFGPNERFASEVDSDVEVGYMLAEIKKLEREAKEAADRNDKKVTVNRYEKIISIYI